MEAFVSRKRRQVSSTSEPSRTLSTGSTSISGEDDSTDLKLAVLASRFPDVDQTALFDLLITAHGSVDNVINLLSDQPPTSPTPPRKGTSRVIGCQTSLSQYSIQDPLKLSKRLRPLTRKGQTLHLYSPTDIAAHTPCSIIHNFLPPSVADALLRELLLEVPTFGKQTFKLFDNVVSSPHTASFYVDSLEEAQRQETEYLYNGSYLSDIRQITPKMREVKTAVQEAINTEIETRIRDFYPEGKKLKHQSPDAWIPNAAFVNCYAGGAESVGYHSDQLTYLGPRAVIGSLSLGVAREFRVRKIIPQQDTTADDDDNNNNDNDNNRADLAGQIAIHLPHNSLLTMHAEMQESYKHAIAPSPAIDPHPIAGNKRINITYRHYRDDFHPKYTPRCKCGVATVLKCVQRKKESQGRYMWMCHVGNTPGKEGCGYFQWAEFDGDGRPPWTEKKNKKKKERDAV